MGEQLTAANCWSGCQLTEHVEEVRRRQTEVMRLLPWLIADPLLVEALELMSSAVTELIEHHDGLREDEMMLLRVIQS
jgi:bacteriorhodopsin